MNKIVSKFGKWVGANIPENPEKARQLLKIGFSVSLYQSKIFPDRSLLPHQQFAYVMNTDAILKPFRNPDRAAIVNLFFPCELLWAMDIDPFFTEGMAAYLNGAACEHSFIRYAEDSGIPQTYCSYHKALLGAVLSNVIPVPRFAAYTTLACDANLNTFRSIADYFHIPCFAVDVPGLESADTVAYVSDQLRDLANAVGHIMGKRLDEDRLKEIIRRENHCVRMACEQLDLLADRFIPTDLTSEMNKIFPTHVNIGTENAEKYFRLLLEDTRKAKFSEGEKRILWVHTIPYWQESIRNLFNQNRKYQILLSDMNYDFLEESDENAPYDALARKLIRNPMNGRGQRRSEHILNLAKKLKAHGVVYFCHWGCKQTLGNARLTSERLQKAGYPVLILDGDGCDHNNINDGQMITKLQAFLEMLETNR